MTDRSTSCKRWRKKTTRVWSNLAPTLQNLAGTPKAPRERVHHRRKIAGKARAEAVVAGREARAKPRRDHDFAGYSEGSGYMAGNPCRSRR